MSAPCPILGFVVELQLQTEPSAVAADRLHAALVELLEARGLSGGTRPNLGSGWSFIVQSVASQATELDREAVLAWARGRAEVASAWAAPIGDVAP
jgi:hypothetical protein